MRAFLCACFGPSRPKIPEEYLRPQGLYALERVDLKKLRRLIRNQQLAPCHPGIEEPAPGQDLEECPICFLHYPVLNSSLCCQKRVCTECFLQVQTSTPPHQLSACPFCKVMRQTGYLVKLVGAKTAEEKEQERVEEQKVIEARIREREEELRRDQERAMQRLQEQQARQAAAAAAGTAPPGASPAAPEGAGAGTGAGAHTAAVPLGSSRRPNQGLSEPAGAVSGRGGGDGASGRVSGSGAAGAAAAAVGQLGYGRGGAAEGHGPARGGGNGAVGNGGTAGRSQTAAQRRAAAAAAAADRSGGVAAAYHADEEDLDSLEAIAAVAAAISDQEGDDGAADPVHDQPHNPHGVSNGARGAAAAQRQRQSNGGDGRRYRLTDFVPAGVVDIAMGLDDINDLMLEQAMYESLAAATRQQQQQQQQQRHVQQQQQRAGHSRGPRNPHPDLQEREARHQPTSNRPASAAATPGRRPHPRNATSPLAAGASPTSPRGAPRAGSAARGEAATAANASAPAAASRRRTANGTDAPDASSPSASPTHAAASRRPAPATPVALINTANLSTLVAQQEPPVPSSAEATAASSGSPSAAASPRASSTRAAAGTWQTAAGSRPTGDARLAEEAAAAAAGPVRTAPGAGGVEAVGAQRAEDSEEEVDDDPFAHVPLNPAGVRSTAAAAAGSDGDRGSAGASSSGSGAGGAGAMLRSSKAGEGEDGEELVSKRAGGSRRALEPRVVLPPAASAVAAPTSPACADVGGMDIPAALSAPAPASAPLPPAAKSSPTRADPGMMQSGLVADGAYHDLGKAGGQPAATGVLPGDAPRTAAGSMPSNISSSSTTTLSPLPSITAPRDAAPSARWARPDPLLSTGGASAAPDVVLYDRTSSATGEELHQQQHLSNPLYDMSSCNSSIGGGKHGRPSGDLHAQAHAQVHARLEAAAAATAAGTAQGAGAGPRGLCSGSSLSSFSVLASGGDGPAAAGASSGASGRGHGQAQLQGDSSSSPSDTDPASCASVRRCKAPHAPPVLAIPADPQSAAVPPTPSSVPPLSPGLQSVMLSPGAANTPSPRLGLPPLPAALCSQPTASVPASTSPAASPPNAALSDASRKLPVGWRSNAATPGPGADTCMPPGDAYTWLDTPTKDKGDTEPTGPTSVAPAADSTTTPVSLHALAVELLRHGSEAQAAAAKGVAAAGGGAAGPSRGSSRDKVVAVVAMVLLQPDDASTSSQRHPAPPAWLPRSLAGPSQPPPPAGPAIAQNPDGSMLVMTPAVEDQPKLTHSNAVQPQRPTQPRRAGRTADLDAGDILDLPYEGDYDLEYGEELPEAEAAAAGLVERRGVDVGDEVLVALCEENDRQLAAVLDAADEELLLAVQGQGGSGGGGCGEGRGGKGGR